VDGISVGGGRVCVIIPSKGRAQRLAACIASVLASDYGDKEVLVVDDGLCAETLAGLRDFRDRITVFGSNGRGPSYARNLAASKTTAQYLAFTDSDCVVDAHWLSALVEGFRRRPDAVSVGGIQEVCADASTFETEVFAFMRKAHFVADYARCPADQAMLMEVDHNASCNVMYKREVFLKEGGFREGLWPGEDVDLDYRLRKNNQVLLCTRAAVVYHDKPETLARFRRMMYSYGRAQGELVRLHAGIFRKIQIVPLIVLLLCGVVFARPVLGLSVWLLLGVTAAAYLRSRVVSVLALNALVCWNAGFLIGVIRGMYPSNPEVSNPRG
jgi:GT2 family glycosyltransferase